MHYVVMSDSETHQECLYYGVLFLRVLHLCTLKKELRKKEELKAIYPDRLATSDLHALCICNRSFTGSSAAEEDLTIFWQWAVWNRQLRFRYTNTYTWGGGAYFWTGLGGAFTRCTSLYALIETGQLGQQVHNTLVSRLCDIWYRHRTSRYPQNIEYRNISRYNFLPISYRNYKGPIVWPFV